MHRQALTVNSHGSEPGTLAMHPLRDGSRHIGKCAEPPQQARANSGAADKDLGRERNPDPDLGRAQPSLNLAIAALS